MAAQESGSVRAVTRALPRPAAIAGKWAGRTLLALMAVVILFLLAAWIGAAIPRNADWTEPDSGVTIMVETNGIHTALVLPLVTPEKDWRTVFPATDLPASRRDYTHISVSWGEREVFLNTPTWSDLSPLTALRVATIGGDSLLHVAHYVRPAPSDTARPLRITSREYAAIVKQIEAAMQGTKRSAVYPGYTDYDVFYDAAGRYDITNTCNQWTSDTLAAAGVKAGWWTPFAGGVMKWVPKVRE
ncbi:MAG: TIGR02117 family protein [Allopontixanthobacter sediminis]